MSSKIHVHLLFLILFFVTPTQAKRLSHSRINVNYRDTDCSYVNCKVSDTLNPNKKIPFKHTDSVRQTDLVDLFRKVLVQKKQSTADSVSRASRLVHLSIVPAAGYSLTTGFAALLGMNLAFYTAKNHDSTNLSTGSTNLTFTSKGQILFPIQTNIWSPGNKYNLITDWRLYKFPQETFGLGGRTSLNKGYTINYSYFRLYTTVLRKIVPSFYMGLGFDLDYYYNIEEILSPARKKNPRKTTFERYGSGTYERASGITLNALFDTRDNPINATKGLYADLVFRSNRKFLGSTSNWKSVILDIRKYVKIGGTRSVFAFWNYDWITYGGKPPFFDLPNTGGDTYNNSGRGFIQGRFRDNQMLYLETEFRYVITHNGLLGGVLFANSQSFSRKLSGELNTLNTAFGVGLRIKLNKFSNTNIAIDYGLGLDGSKGLFINLGEVF